MSRGINKVILVGNLGADPEMRYMPSGDPVANLRIATSEGWRDKSTGNFQERTEWHTVVMYGKLAKVGGEFLKKGSKVYIEGRMRTEKWQTRDGQDRYTTKVIADTMQMLDSRGSNTTGGDSSFAESRRQSGGANQDGATSAPSNNQENLGFDDDIPF